MLRFKRNVVKYVIIGRKLYEYNKYSDIVNQYNLDDSSQKMVFQVRLKHFARYHMKVQITTDDLYYLHIIRWL